jgi:hypothetical protein
MVEVGIQSIPFVTLPPLEGYHWQMVGLTPHRTVKSGFLESFDDL